MKALCSLLAALLVATVRADPVVADGRITDVTVYADRAQVTRTVEVALTPGENRIPLTNLPVALVDDSVRAAGKAGVPVTIQDVEVRSVVREQASDASAKEMEARLLKLRDESAALDARQRVLDEQRSFLSQIQVKAAGDVSRDVQINKFDLEQLKDLPAFITGESTRIDEEAQKLVIARRELEPRIQAAEAEFKKREVAASKASKTVIVTVNAKEATKLQLQVSYVLGGASWVPTYDARAATDAGNVEFTYNGVVRQQTGEDWRGINLTLSTARPAIGAQMPELGKWTVDFIQQYPPLGGESAAPAPLAMLRRKAATESVTAENMEPADAQIATAPQQAHVEQGVTSATFHVPRAADVPSDGEPHRQTIAVQSLPASFRYETTPKLSTAAYLKATSTNSTDAPFLAGTVNVFVGADFVGTGRMETVAPTEVVKLFLGTDDAIRVKREELKDRRGKSGFFNRRQQKVSGYKITVENFKNNPQHIVVFDQLPVPGNDDIKVGLADSSTKPTETDAGTGKLTWDIVLKPHEKREIVMEFTVDWPQDRQVSGM